MEVRVLNKEIQSNSLIHRLLEKEKFCGDQVYLKQAKQGVWTEYTWSEIMKLSRKVAAFLQQIGLQRGDRVSIYSKNCVEWFIIDFGITLAGMIGVPLFANQNSHGLHYVIRHADVQLVFVGKLDSHQRAFSALPSTVKTVNLTYHPNIETTYQWQDILACDPLQEITIPEPESIYTIIYSSGTTGQPKGVLFNYATVTRYIGILKDDLSRIIDVEDRHYLFSYLPLAHVYERASIQIVSLVLDSEVAFCESLEQFSRNLQATQPTVFAAVPRIWTLFKQQIEQRLSPHVLKMGLMIPVVSYFLKRKIQWQLGLSRCQFHVSGAAHLPQEILKFFTRLGIEILEGYGQTENFSYGTVSLPNRVRPGFVGRARFGTSVELSADGEILMRSPVLMQGYYKDEEATKHAFTSKGLLRTGDLGEIDADGNVKIYGRVSEHFKNQKGEYVVPSVIEEQVIQDELVAYCCLIGRMLPSNVLLLNLNDIAQKYIDDELKNKLRLLFRHVNVKLNGYEKISHFIVTSEKWTVDNHCLTPTHKVKRWVLESKYQNVIEHALKGQDTIVWE